MTPKKFLSLENWQIIWQGIKKYLSSGFVKNGTARPTLTIQVVDSLPSNPSNDVLYFVKEP